MDKESAIRQLKRKAYLAYHQDGIVDGMVGLAILGFGLWICLDQPIFAFLYFLSLGLYVPLKNAITVPRFGYVRFQEGKREIKLLICVGIGLLLLTLVMAVLMLLGPERVGLAPIPFLRKFHVYIMSSIGAALLGIFGLWSGIRRLVGYAFLLTAALVVTITVGLDRYAPLVVTGISMMLAGLVLMARFIRDNAGRPGEANHAA